MHVQHHNPYTPGENVVRTVVCPWQKEESCLETCSYKDHSQAARPTFQELHFNDAQQAFQVRYLLKGAVKRVVELQRHSPCPMQRIPQQERHLMHSYPR